MNKHSKYALDLINQLTIEEKIALVQGHNFMYTNAVPRLSIPFIRMSDGPHGLRVQDNENASGVMGNSSSTAFPTAATSSNSWNPNLLFKMGQAMGEEAKYYGINIVLGPGVNIKRNPLCGRNFEYFSEDPILAGRLGAEEVKGLQNEGVGVSSIPYLAIISLVKSPPASVIIAKFSFIMMSLLFMCLFNFNFPRYKRKRKI